MSLSVPQYLTLTEAAAAARCHPKTLQRAVKAGRLQAHRINGRELRFLGDQLTAWMSGSTSSAVKEVAK